MARSIRSSGLETRSARLRLPISAKPVWITIGPGLGLGYRRNKTEGMWAARLADGRGGYTIRNIATADDYAEADDRDLLDFWQAQAKARQLAKGETVQETAAIVSLGQALDRYEADLRTRRGDVGNVTRVRGHLNAALLRKAVALLTVADLRRWRDALAKRQAPATVNRITAALKAALNLAADHDDRITSRRPWEIGLATIEGAVEARNVILNEMAIRKIIDEARAISPEFGLYVETAAATGTRPSQLWRVEVQDLIDHGDTVRLSIPVSAKGKGTKKIQRRAVPIGNALAARLRLAAQDRPATAPLLLKPSGEPWAKSDHSRLFERAAKAAGEGPEVTFYSLRHSSIVRQLLAGVPVRLVAVNHDTSVGMLERHYSRHIEDHGDAIVRAAVLDVADVAVDGKIVPIRG